MYLVDTNVISEVRRQQRAHPNVRRWFAMVDTRTIYLSVLVLGEIRAGAERVRERDPAKATELDGWLKQVMEKHKRRILGVDYEVARLWGWMKGRFEVPVIDGLLAATAQVHDLILVTRNVKDVERTGVNYLDPFAAR
jgi:predicted nucleic acid-binding protein